MLSKAKTKLIRSLSQKKQRDAHNLFIAEGPKVVEELLQTFVPEMIVATQEWTRSFKLYAQFQAVTTIVTQQELTSISLQQHPQEVIAILKKPLIDDERHLCSLENDKLYIALDDVQDPGNLGTIIRIADWFGVRNIICSNNTVDVYNPKVVQATMGSIARVRVSYTNLADFLRRRKGNIPIYGTLLNGDNIYNNVLTRNGIIVMGNEGNGLSTEIQQLIDRRLLIPTFQQGRSAPDSLNVAVATAIVCSEFKRG